MGCRRGCAGCQALRLARAVASRLLCAAALADRCGDEPVLIAAYGTEVGPLVRRAHALAALRAGVAGGAGRASGAVVKSECSDAAEQGYVRRTEVWLPVSAFVHVVDCRPDAAEQWEDERRRSPRGKRVGNLYIQYWTYYADSATLRGIPIVGEKGYHRDDWEECSSHPSPRSVDERA